MSELKDLIASVDAAEVAAQGDLEALLPHIRDHRDNAAGSTAIANKMAEPVKTWLQLNEPEKLYYLEKDGPGLVAFLEGRKTDNGYDMARLAKDNPALFARCVKVVALTINKKIAAEHGLLGELKPFENPSGLINALKIEKLKE